MAANFMQTNNLFQERRTWAACFHLRTKTQHATCRAREPDEKLGGNSIAEVLRRTGLGSQNICLCRTAVEKLRTYTFRQSVVILPPGLLTRSNDGPQRFHLPRLPQPFAPAPLGRRRLRGPRLPPRRLRRLPPCPCLPGRHRVL